MLKIVYASILLLFSFSLIGNAQISDTYCPDIIIKDIQILNQKGKKVTIVLTIENIGNMKATVEGKTPAIQDNLGWRAYLSTDLEFNGGDILTGGDYFKGLKALPPGETMTMKSTIKMLKITSFTNNLIIDIDAGEVVQECDEINNNKGITLFGGSKKEEEN